jgi:hypothetical protein
MKGIITYWGHDVKQIKEILLGVIGIVSKVSINPLIKDNVVKDVEKCVKLLCKGKEREE